MPFVTLHAIGDEPVTPNEKLYGTPTVPLAVGVPVTVGGVGALTVNETACGADAPFEFVATTEKFVVLISPVAGVPLRIPVLGFKVAQVGTALVVTDQPPVGIA